MYTTTSSRSTSKCAPKFVDDTHVLVTKEFAKKAMVFDSPEYKLWRRIKAERSDAEMVTKSINKNANKRTATKNMTYERMAMYIREQDKAAELMAEFKKQIALSQVQTNPYRCVLAWFKQTFQNYDGYKAFFEAEKEAKKKDIFTLVTSSSVVIEAEDTEDNEENE